MKKKMTLALVTLLSISTMIAYSQATISSFPYQKSFLLSPGQHDYTEVLVNVSGSILTGEAESNSTVDIFIFDSLWYMDWESYGWAPELIWFGRGVGVGYFRVLIPWGGSWYIAANNTSSEVASVAIGWKIENPEVPNPVAQLPLVLSLVGNVALAAVLIAMWRETRRKVKS